MKRLFYLLALVSGLMLGSCISDAQVTYREYYDSETSITVVYVDNIPYYRIWEDYRWIYRPVPRERFPFIHLRPHNNRHEHWRYNNPPQGGRKKEHNPMNQPKPQQGGMGGFMNRVGHQPQTINRGNNNPPMNNRMSGHQPQTINRGGGNMQNRGSQTMRGGRR